MMVFVSACASENDNQKGCEEAANEYITNPFSPTKTHQEVTQLMEAHKI
jgi:CheY-like chemotaxis protein